VWVSEGGRERDVYRESETDELTFVMHFERNEQSMLFLFLCLNKFKFVIS